jgi:hypothetical protein
VLCLEGGNHLFASLRPLLQTARDMKRWG